MEKVETINCTEKEFIDYAHDRSRIIAEFLMLNQWTRADALFMFQLFCAMQYAGREEFTRKDYINYMNMTRDDCLATWDLLQNKTKKIRRMADL